jgi:hypothetical protein
LRLVFSHREKGVDSEACRLCEGKAAWKWRGNKSVRTQILAAVGAENWWAALGIYATGSPATRRFYHELDFGGEKRAVTWMPLRQLI